MAGVRRDVPRAERREGEPARGRGGGMPGVRGAAHQVPAVPPKSVRDVAVNPQCPTNFEPDVVVGRVQGRAPRRAAMASLWRTRARKSGKRFIRCTNYDECGTSYPLPARGKLEATGEVCEHWRRAHRGGRNRARPMAHLREHGLPRQGEEGASGRRSRQRSWPVPRNDAIR